MEIVKFDKRYIKDISKLMLKDLENPPRKFPKKMIVEFVNHAKEEGIKREFDNPNLIGFLAIEKGKVIGFIVGYLEDKEYSIIDYLTGKPEVKKFLLEKFIQYCKNNKTNYIKTESFEFMDNHNFFEKNGFKIIGKKEIRNNLIIFYRKLSL